MQSSVHHKDLGSQQEKSGSSKIILIQCHLSHVIMPDLMENNSSLPSLAHTPATLYPQKSGFWVS